MLFYAIRLIPDINPNRIKIGFTNHLEKRLIPYMTALPTLQVVKTWKTKLGWEREARRYITEGTCHSVFRANGKSSEVFDCYDEGKFIQRADEFFKHKWSGITKQIIISDTKAAKKKLKAYVRERIREGKNPVMVKAGIKAAMTKMGLSHT